jgi:hypothetical protein
MDRFRITIKQNRGTTSQRTDLNLLAHSNGIIVNSPNQVGFTGATWASHKDVLSGAICVKYGLLFWREIHFGFLRLN